MINRAGATPRESRAIIQCKVLAMLSNDRTDVGLEFELAQLIRRLVQEQLPVSQPVARNNAVSHPRPVDLAQVLLTMQQRRLDVVQSDDLLDEVSWTILLDLFVAAQRGRPVSISSACIGAQAPASTALRHIHQLTHAGLTTRYADPKDGRRIYLQISPAAAERMEKWLHMLYDAITASSR